MRRFNFNTLSGELRHNRVADLTGIISRYLSDVFTLDLRALALLRIGTASIVLLDLAIRSTDLSAHYSNEGILPLFVLFGHAWGNYTFSIHVISGLWQVQAILFLIEALAAVFLLLGKNTGLASFIVWMMHLSLQNRNPYILQGGDDLLRMILFWGMFLPWGRMISLDSRNNTNARYLGMAGVAYILQIAFVYYFSALLKTGAEWRSDYTALYYALSLDQMVFPLGKLIYYYPQLLKFLTGFTFYLELLAPLLLLIPLKNQSNRILFIILITGLHIGISLTLFVGLFFIIGIISLAGLIPGTYLNISEKAEVPFLKLKARALMLENKISKYFNFELYVDQQIIHGKFLRFSRNIFLSMCLLFIIFWNIQNTGKIKRVTEPLNWLGTSLRIDQNWGMFAPCVFKDDGWYILEGTTYDGKRIDLNRDGAPVNYVKPKRVVSLFKNDRWRKYSENYLFISNTFLRNYYSDYMYDRWNENHPDKKIHDLKVIYMKEISLPDYKLPVPSKEILAETYD